MYLFWNHSTHQQKWYSKTFEADYRVTVSGSRIDLREGLVVWDRLCMSKVDEDHEIWIWTELSSQGSWPKVFGYGVSDLSSWDGWVWVKMKLERLIWDSKALHTVPPKTFLRFHSVSFNNLIRINRLMNLALMCHTYLHTSTHSVAWLERSLLFFFSSLLSVFVCVCVYVRTFWNRWCSLVTVAENVTDPESSEFCLCILWLAEVWREQDTVTSHQTWAGGRS